MHAEGAGLRVGVFGGSFNPPHIGHALVAAWALWTDLVDEVWLVPVFEHAFEKGQHLAPFDRRVSWCEQLAADVDVRVRVSTVESGLPTPSYTLHTLQTLSSQHPDHSFRLIVGADVLEKIDEWHRWDDIRTAYSPIIVGRAGYPPVEGAPAFPQVSSTQLRARLDQGLSIEGFVTSRVAKALRERSP